MKKQANYGTFNGYIALTEKEAIYLKKKTKKSKVKDFGSNNTLSKANKKSKKKYKPKNKNAKPIQQIIKKSNTLPDIILTKVGQNAIPSPMENRVRTILNTFDIEYLTEVSFKGLQTGKTDASLLRFDFYLPSKGILIEYDGKDYHYTKSQKARDKMKNDWCKIHPVKLVRFSAKDIPTLYEQICELIVTS